MEGASDKVIIELVRDEGSGVELRVLSRRKQGFAPPSMKRLLQAVLFALGLASIGLALGFANYGLDRIFETIHLSPPWSTRAGYAALGFLGLLFVGLIALLLWWLYDVAVADRPSPSEQRITALKAVDQIFGGAKKLGGIYSSLDGRFLHLIVAVPASDRQKIEALQALDMPYSIADDYWLFQAFVVYENGRVLTWQTPSSLDSLICQITFYFKIKGLKRIALTFLRGTVRLFHESEGWLVWGLMSVFNFFIAYIQSGIHDRWQKHFDQVMIPLFNSEDEGFVKNVPEVEFSHIEVLFTSGKNGFGPLFITLEQEEGFSEGQGCFLVFYRFRPFKPKLLFGIVWPQSGE